MINRKKASVYYLRQEYIQYMSDMGNITKKDMTKTHVKMPISIGVLGREDAFVLLNDGGDKPNPLSSQENQEFIRKHKLHTSMSVGDIIEIGGNYYLCEDIGWKELT